MSHVMPTYARANLRFTHGEGPWLFDDKGTKYFDFGAGIAVNTFGHANARLRDKLADQAGKLWHVSNLYEIPEQEVLATKLCENSFADVVFFTNSGTEAVELAIKMARKYHFENGAPRDEIITFEGAFHGRSTGAIAAAGAEKLTAGFGALMPGFRALPFNDIDALEAAVSENTAAIMLEPIQGEGGIRVADDVFLRAVRDLADKHDALVIFDEIQCGVGRTGKMFYHQWLGIPPDIMTVAKGIGGGFPLGACVATKAAAKGMVAGTHGSTYGGNPLACAIGAEVMDMFEEEDTLSHVNALAGRMRQKLEFLVSEYPNVFEEVRGAGLMLGLKLKVPSGDFVAEGRNLRVLTVGAADNVVRLLPPLNLSFDELDEGISRLERTAQKLNADMDKA